jgi:hypothetical protein
LTNITIDNRVSSIGAYAFYDCLSLKKVYCKPVTPPTGWYGMFLNSDEIPIGCDIYVPTESVEAYKSAAYWSYYASDIVGYDF